MIDGIIIVDAVVHPWNMSPENQNPAAQALIDDVSVGDDGAVAITLCLTDSACVHYLRMEAYIIDALWSLAGVTSVKVRQTLDKLWTPDRVNRKAA